MDARSVYEMEGYGSYDIVRILGKMEWVAAVPKGKSFPGFVFDSHQLHTHFSVILNRRYRITLESIPSRKKFSATGYTDYQLIAACKEKTLREMRIAGYTIEDRNFQKLQESLLGSSFAYKLTIEKLELTEDDEDCENAALTTGFYV